MKIFFCVSLILSSLALTVFAQNPIPSPTTSPRVVGEVDIKATKANIDPVYTSLRNLSEDTNAFGGEYATVNNLVLRKDAATFTLRGGEIYFLKSMHGKTTGAVFLGDGEMSLKPPVESERKMMMLFTGTPNLSEGFTELVIFFTDKTYDEIKNSPNAKMGVGGSQSSKARSIYKSKEGQLRTEFKYNITTRTLMDIYGPERPGFFTTFINGKKYNKLVFQLDPLGIEEVSPEQVMLLNYNETDGGIWSAFHLAEEYKKRTGNSSQDRRVFDLINHEIDIAIKGNRLIATDKATMTNRVSGQRVLPFDLFRPLRVKRVLDESGADVDFIQEDKNRDGSLAVILPSAPEVGKPFKLTFEYEGEEALSTEGAGNFFLLPRSTWYPNNGGTQFGDRATFEITFRYPKKYTLVGVGELAEQEKTEGDTKIAYWSTKGAEMAVAGFNYGDFVRKDLADAQTGYLIESYANKELPNSMKSLQQEIQRRESAGEKFALTLDAVNTTTMASTILNQTQNSVRIFDYFFGKLPHKRVAMTQQPADNFGQAWPTLIFMPFSAYMDTTIRTQLYGTRGGTSLFFKEVAAHEVAHQWWGHAVGWTSYHDQWMSEGFAQLSASLYIQYVKKDVAEFNDFWEEQRLDIIEASPQTKGLKPYTIGPVTQGYRLTNGKTGRATRYLIYPKGAYILHMIRMMMFDKKTGDENFRNMMKDFIASHYNKDVSTEDFKVTVEKHMTPKMDVDKNKKMDWFFDKWVYGTDVPAYTFEYSLNDSGLTAKLTQSGVSDDFVMLVPIYVDYGKGWQLLGSATVVGNNTLDMGNIKLPQAPKKVAICAYNDVLATKIENVKK